MARQNKKQNKVTWRVSKVNKIDNYLCSTENMNASLSHLTSDGGTNAVDPLLPAPLSNYELSREVEALEARVDCCEELIIYLCDQQEQEQEEEQEKKQQQQQQQQQASQEVLYGEIVRFSLSK